MAQIRLKPSKYNFFFPVEEDEKIIAYNAFTAGVAIVDKSEINTIENILKEPNEYNYNTKRKLDLKKSLIRGGFLIDEYDNELEKIKLDSLIGRYGNMYSLGITIVPTLKCNLKCTYCFEEKKKIDMSEEVEEALVKYVETGLGDGKFLNISWFGGEPTLKLKQIKRLSEKFNEIVKKKNGNYSASMITNGYLLNKKVAGELRDLRIRSLQVTVDGPKDLHDQMRPQVNGKGTYDRIMKNIETCHEIIPISIRVNVNKKNQNRVIELLTDLEKRGLKNKVNIYFAPIKKYTDICGSSGDDGCFKSFEFAQLENQLYKEFIAKGFTFKHKPQRIYGAYCGANRMNSILVTPKGDLFKCYCEISFSEDHSVGNLLKNPTGIQRKNFRKWLLHDPFQLKECIACNLLPVCQGGCPYYRQLIETKNYKDKNCAFYKFNSKKMLNLIYQQYKINNHQFSDKKLQEEK